MFFIGDVHGKWDEYFNLISKMDQSIQVGDFGFGFNPPTDWHPVDLLNYGLSSIVPGAPSAIFTPQNQSFFNISFSIEPIDSIFESKNLSAKVENWARHIFPL